MQTVCNSEKLKLTIKASFDTLKKYTKEINTKIRFNKKYPLPTKIKSALIFSPERTHISKPSTYINSPKAQFVKLQSTSKSVVNIYNYHKMKSNIGVSFDDKMPLITDRCRTVQKHNKLKSRSSLLQSLLPASSSSSGRNEHMQLSRRCVDKEFSSSKYVDRFKSIKSRHTRMKAQVVPSLTIFDKERILKYLHAIQYKEHWTKKFIRLHKKSQISK